MAKKQELHKKNSLLERFSATKKVWVMVLFVFFLMGFVSSAEFDNIGNYKNDGKTIEITNLFGFGNKIAEITLDTPSVNYVIAGRNRLVAEFTIVNEEDYDSVFNQMDFYDIKKGMKNFDREFSYKYKETYQVTIPDYATNCKEKNLNGTIEYYDCNRIKIGEHNEDRNRWIDFNSESQLQKGTTTIGIFTNVYSDDYVEWIPTLFGVEVNEWAVWQSSYNIGLVHYYNLDSTSGSVALDSIVGTNQSLEFSGTPLWSTGKIEGGLNVSAGNYLTVSNLTHMNLSGWSFSMWVFENDTAGSEQGLTGAGGFGGVSGEHVFNKQTGGGYWWTLGGRTKTAIGLYAPDEWKFIVGTINETGHYTWVNGSLDISVAFDSGTNVTNWSDFYVGRNQDYNMTGIIDEVGLWNRTLTPTEISQMYNGEVGMSYRILNATTTLNFPADDYENISNIVIFNCSGEDAIQIDNITLIIDGISNVTLSGSSTLLSLQQELTVPFGNHTWTCNATNNNNDIGTATARTFQLGFVENSQTYNQNTLSGSNELFLINMNYNNTQYTSIKASLFYNGTEYPSLQPPLVDKNISFNKTIIVPSVSTKTNLSFYWQIGLYDEAWRYINSTFYNQTVDLIGVDDCSTYTTLIYNYTLYDEETQIKLANDTSIDIQVSFYDISKTVLVANYSKAYFGTNPAQICLNGTLLQNTNYSVDSVVIYSANNSITNVSYATESYNILGDLIGNSTIPKHIKLYDLNEQDSTEFQLTFRDSSFALAGNVLVYLYRQYVADNDFKVVEIPLTDSNGQTILHMVRNDVIYNFVMVDADGNILATFNRIIAFCQDYTIGECTIYLSAPADVDDIYDYNEEFGISYTAPTYSNTTGLVSFSFITNNLTSRTVRMDVIRNNDFGNRSVCSNSLTSASGTLSCNVSSVSSTDRFLFLNIFVDGNLMTMLTLDLEGDDFGFGTVNGAFYAFLLMLFMITIFMNDKQALTLSLLVGWAIVVGLGLINGALIGALSGGIWLVVCIIIFIWKLKGEEES